MIKTNIITGAIFLLTASSFSLQAATIIDTYIGANNNGHGDVIGSGSNFQIDSMEVELNGAILTVSINTGFAGKGDNGLFSGITLGKKGIGYGDLFLSSAWVPNGDGTQDYINDDASNGTVWTYGFSLDDRWMNENDAGTGALYSLGSANNEADILMADDFLTGGVFRNGQEVAVDRSAQGVTALVNDANWAITGSTVDFSVDLAGTSLLNGSDIALHWGFTCANDVIEGSMGVSPVPVPAAAWLFGSGLLGIAAISRLIRS